MPATQRFPWWLFGCVALAAAIVVANIGIKQAHAHIVPTPPSIGATVVLDDISSGKARLGSAEFGLVQMSGNRYRPHRTRIEMGSGAIEIPMTIPWFLATSALLFTGLALLLVPCNRRQPRPQKGNTGLTQNHVCLPHLLNPTTPHEQTRHL